MKLMSMTEFVLQENYKIQSIMLPEIFIKQVINYAKFLKQPLKLEMFIPCNGQGEILNYEEIRESVKEGTENWGIWEQAVNNVLFKGFEVEKNICFNGLQRTTVDYGIFIPTMGTLTVEDLINNNKTPLELTELAIIKIGLWLF